MKLFSAFIRRHRNMLLMSILCMTLCLSSIVTSHRLDASRGTTTLPVMKTQSADATPVAVFTDARETAYEQDVAALTALCGQEGLDAHTREDAAEALTQLVRDHAAQQALEAALSESVLAPCACVVSGGNVTIVTQLTSVTEEASALALTLAAAHANAAPGDVRIVTAE